MSDDSGSSFLGCFGYIRKTPTDGNIRPRAMATTRVRPGLEKPGHILLSESGYSQNFQFPAGVHGAHFLTEPVKENPMSTTLVAAVITIAVVLVVGVLALQALMPKPKENLGSYSPTPLMNKSEIKVMAALDAALPEVFGPGARVFGQVSYREFARGDDQSSKAMINQKRADFVIVGPAGEILCIVEYQGAGHFGRGQKSRERVERNDRVKRHAAKSCDYPFAEIPAKFTEESVKEALKELLLGKS